MKAVILAGGLGTRLAEETITKPKPMVEIGGKPILWHIMKIYSCYGINEFIVCCGYKGHIIKEYFNNSFIQNSDFTIDLMNNKKIIHNNNSEKWKVTLVDTGDNTMTGGRLKRVKEYVKNDELFCFTYGDGLSDINIKDLINFHKDHGKLATLSAVYPPGRFGTIDIEENLITRFIEKPKGDGSMVNGGFFVLSPKVIDYINDDSTIWEREPLQSLSNDKELMAYKHMGFWQPMDKLSDKINLQKEWDNGTAKWKIWK